MTSPFHNLDKTFQYDTRLGDKSAYLKADYTIQRDDPRHQGFVVYASVMAAFYCFGIPAISWYALHLKKDGIQKVQLLCEMESNEELRKLFVDTIPQGDHRQRRRTTLQREIFQEATRRSLLSRSDVAISEDDILRIGTSMKIADPW